ncbi:Na+/proline symporter [Bradyrhizobium sp. LB9.1b]
MLHDWGVIAAAFGYIGFLFLVASHGDRRSPAGRGRASGLIYPLSLAIYCTSWTFFGSVGFATRTSTDFLAIYVGPILMIGLGAGVLRRVIQLAKAHNITSIADFIGARYGKSQAVAATVALIAIIGSVPYIALQLKAVASSLETILGEDQAFSHIPIVGDMALMVTLAMAAFAVLFGTRQTDATEHQHGLMLAVATESIIKLVAFLTAGIFVTFWMFSPHELIERAMKTPEAVRAINYSPSIGNFLTMTLLSLCAIMLLPRQFHVSVVENSSDAEVGRARWLFPLYLVAINLFVIPIALAGLISFPFGTADPDMYVLALPMEGGANLLSVAVFVGGLSAATAMVIVECVALSIMVSNDLVMPLVLQRRPEGRTGGADFSDFLLRSRRLAIFAIMVMAYFYYRALGNTQLAAIGLLSFAAIAQLAPSFFGGLLWRRATARGAIGGMLVGFAVWLYTLFIPSFMDSSTSGILLLQHGPFGIEALRPQALFGADLPPLMHGVIWSLSLNILTYVLLSLGAPAVFDRAGAGRSVRAQHAGADLAELPPLAHHGHGAGHPDHGGAISRAGPRAAFVRGILRAAQCAAGARGTRRFRAAAARRAPDRLLDRRGLLAARDVAAAAQADGLRQGCTQAARRFPCGAAFQPRDPPDRAQPCASGHRGVRCRSATDLLQPAVRRSPQRSPAFHPVRHAVA